MAIVKIIQGDLIKLFKNGYFQAIGHGCNCKNLMGAGIAAQISSQIPEAYAADTEFYKRMGGDNHTTAKGIRGHISVAKVTEGYVINMYTQLLPGRHASYQLLQSACEKLNSYCKQRSITRVGLPLVGAGIGGLDVMAAATIIGLATPDIDVTLVVWTGDEKNWKALEGFTNYGFPRKFDSVVVRTGKDTFAELVGGVWRDTTFDAEKSNAQWHMGEYAVSFSDTEPAVFLVLDSKDELDKNRHRLY